MLTRGIVVGQVLFVTVLADLHTHVLKDDSEAKAGFHEKLTAAKESLHKAEEDLKKHL